MLKIAVFRTLGGTSLLEHFDPFHWALTLTQRGVNNAYITIAGHHL